MQPHITRTIEDIELKIGFLQRLADALRNFDTVTAVGAPVMTVPAANGHTPRKGRGRKLAAGRVALPGPKMRACKPSRGSADTLRIAGAVEKLAEPFTAADVAGKAGIEHKRASNFITVSLAKGWLSRVSAGKYKRLSGYGGGVTGENLLAEIHREIDSQKPKSE